MFFVLVGFFLLNWFWSVGFGSDDVSFFVWSVLLDLVGFGDFVLLFSVGFGRLNGLLKKF